MRYFGVDTKLEFSIYNKMAPMTFFVLLVMTIFPIPGTPQSSDHFISNEKKVDISYFNLEIEEMMEEVGVPGLSVAIIENNEVIFSNVYGVKELSSAEKIDEHTLFEAASLSKPYVALIVHELVDEGLIDLDKPIYEYKNNDRLQHDVRYKAITPRMILSHSSGIENWQYLNNPDVLEIRSTPGLKYEYSGEAYNYLAEVVALMLKKTFEEYIKERIIDPLNLKNTSVKFVKKQISDSTFILEPSNYAIGHSIFFDRTYKWINDRPVPSSAMNVTAAEYAKFLTYFFSEGVLSKMRMKEVLTPVVPLEEDNPVIYRGLAFEMNFFENDTIVAHTGSNQGFRSGMFYSVANKRGFVYLSNYDRGYTIASKLSELTSGIEVEPFVLRSFYRQYPSKAISLLKIYIDQDAGPMFKELEEMINSGGVHEDALNELADELLPVDKQLALQVLKSNISLYPDSSTAHWLMGRTYFSLCDYESAKISFSKARELNHKLRDVVANIEECDTMIKDREKRVDFFDRIGTTKKTRIESENYNVMCGIQSENTKDDGGGENIGYIDSGDSVAYRVGIPKTGTYSASFRVASYSGGGEMELWADDEIISTIQIPRTEGFQNWRTVTSKIGLPAGDRMLELRIIKGGFNLNWMEFQIIK